MKSNLKIIGLVSICCMILFVVILTSCGGGGEGGGETPSNTPPTATITSPTNWGSYLEGDPVIFSGTGEDPEDGTLSGASLVWTSDIEGQIGTGQSFTRDDLPFAGVRTITLTATDSDGATGTDSISILITRP